MDENYLLTFEINKDQENVEIHANAQGITFLIGCLEKALKTHDHQHLMTTEWGGDELSTEKQGLANDLINHVKVFYWK